MRVCEGSTERVYMGEKRQVESTYRAFVSSAVYLYFYFYMSLTRTHVLCVLLGTALTPSLALVTHAPHCAVQTVTEFVHEADNGLQLTISSRPDEVRDAKEKRRLQNRKAAARHRERYVCTLSSSM